MTQEDKELLLKDLSARVPYGVIVTDNRHGNSVITEIDTISNTVYCFDFDEYAPIEKCYPYLRPMSSMTEEEKEEYDSIQCDFGIVRVDRVDEIVEFLLSHHFDFVRTNDGLTMIEAGLALEAPERMYNIKEK